MNRVVKPPEPGKRRVYTRKIRLRNGKMIYAASYGLEAFVFDVPDRDRR